MNNTRFDLVNIVRILERQRKFIIVVTVLAMVAGVVFHLVRKTKYEAKSEFFVSNPLLSDRSNLFAGADSRVTYYFGDEDDIDRVLAVAESDSLFMDVIRYAGLDTAYDMDIADPYGAHLLKEKFKDNYKVKRTAYKNVEIYYTDVNAERAARVVNMIVKQIELRYRGIYNGRKMNSYIALSNKIHELDSMINRLTDTLVVMRNESGIYDIMSPTRENLIVGAVKGNGNKTGLYVELIQNYEAEKDILVKDRARYVSLMQQYSTGTGADEMNLFDVISHAKPPADPKGPTLAIILAICFFVGLFFSAALAILTTYYKEVASTRN